MTKLHAQTPNVDIDRSTASIVVDPPHALEELSPRENAPAVLAKKAEQRELLMGELVWTAIDADFVRRQVDVERAHLQVFLLGELAMVPLDPTNSHVELRGDVGHQNEVVETVTHVETRKGAQGHADDDWNLSKCIGTPYANQGGATRIGLIASLDQNGRRRFFFQLVLI